MTIVIYIVQYICIMFIIACISCFYPNDRKTLMRQRIAIKFYLIHCTKKAEL